MGAIGGELARSVPVLAWSPPMTQSVVPMLVLAIAACSRADGNPKLDGGTQPTDARRDATEHDAPPDGAAAAYSHTITIDGADDFLAADTFTTTSASYSAKVAWDRDNLYLGYAGPDLDPAAPQTATKWLFAYLDLDPGAASGAVASQLYRTQRGAFPTGFGAEYYARWKCDGSRGKLRRALRRQLHRRLRREPADHVLPEDRLRVPARTERSREPGAVAPHSATTWCVAVSAPTVAVIPIGPGSRSSITSSVEGPRCDASPTVVCHSAGTPLI